MLIVNLHCQLVFRISGNGNILHKNTPKCKILIVPEEGWFGQPKYLLKSHSALCRFLLLHSSFIIEVDQITMKPTYTSLVNL